MTDAGDPTLKRLADLDRVLEHRTRLAICVLLARSGKMTFSRLKQLLTETDGNLGANLKRLEEAHYVAIAKTFADRRPATWYTLTPAGRRALSQHLGALAGLARRLRS